MALRSAKHGDWLGWGSVIDLKRIWYRNTPTNVIVRQRGGESEDSQSLPPLSPHIKLPKCRDSLGTVLENIHSFLWNIHFSTMTIQTDIDTSALTDSKSRRMVALLTGMSCTTYLALYFIITRIMYFFKLLDFSKSPFSIFSLCVFCSFYETEENGSERLHTKDCNKFLRLQAVSNSSYYYCYYSAQYVPKYITSLYLRPIYFSSVIEHSGLYCSRKPFGMSMSCSWFIHCY